MFDQTNNDVEYLLLNWFGVDNILCASMWSTMGLLCLCGPSESCPALTVARILRSLYLALFSLSGPTVS